MSSPTRFSTRFLAHALLLGGLAAGAPGAGAQGPDGTPPAAGPTTAGKAARSGKLDPAEVAQWAILREMRVKPLPPLDEIAPRPAAEGRGGAEISRAVEGGVAEILARDPAAYERLVLLQRETPDALLPAVVRTVGAPRDDRGLEFLGDVIGWRSQFAGPAIAQVSALGASDSLARNESLARLIRPYLDPESVELCPAAALALGELRDVEAVRPLLDLLENGAPGVRANALWALRRITGLSFPAEPATWRVWFEEEEEWALRSMASVIRALESPDEGEIAAAIQAASYHPLLRHELSEALGRVLDHPRAGLRALVCRTLERLASPVSIPPLIERLEDHDDAVRGSALHALQEITGRRDLPPDPAAWLARE
ncbi:MAG: HEAT repeat domain-containing protein [Planctomycetota bacterium]